MNEPDSMLTTLPLAAFVYVLSYSPYLAIRYEKPTPISIGVAGPHFDLDDEFFANTSHTFYAPVEWLIDHTLLDKLLMMWGDVWSVRDKMRGKS